MPVPLLSYRVGALPPAGDAAHGPALARRSSIATAKVPIASLFKERCDQTVSLTASFASLGRLQVTLSTDWNMVHCPSDYLRHRRKKLQEEERASRPPAAKPSVRVPKDFVKRRVFERAPVPTDEELGLSQLEPSAALHFDAPRYRAFMQKKAPVRLCPLSCTI